MVTSATSVYLLLCALCLVNAAPTSMKQGDLRDLVKAAKYLYDNLSQAMYTVQIQRKNDEMSNFNYGTGTAANGNHNFNFDAGVSDLYINGERVNSNPQMPH